MVNRAYFVAGIIVGVGLAWLTEVVIWALVNA